MQDRLTELLEPSIEGLGYELVLLEVIRGKGVTLRLFIDWLSGTVDESGVAKVVGIEDCEIVSRQVSALLEVEDPISSEYTLEVSSPGLDRPLRKSAHFAEFMGWEAKVVLDAPMDGRRKYRGTIEAVDDETVRLLVDGTAFDLVIADMERARLVFDDERYKAELKSAEKRAAEQQVVESPKD